MKANNDNGHAGAQVIALPRLASASIQVNVPADVSSLVVIGLRPDGKLFFQTECDSLGDVSIILDAARSKVLGLALPDLEDDDIPPPAPLVG